MILIQIIKKYFLFFLILFFFTIISSKTFASNKDLIDEKILDNQIKFAAKRLITKRDTKKWINELNNDLYYVKQKIIINKDYLKLIKIFPSDKNIKSFDINKDLKKYKNELYGYHESINALEKLYQIFNLEENFDIYLVKYDLNIEKSGDQKFLWLSLCTPNFKYDKQVKELRRNLLQVFYFLDNTYYPSHENLINYGKNIGLSESKIHRFVCKEFIDKKLKSI